MLGWRRGCGGDASQKGDAAGRDDFGRCTDLIVLGVNVFHELGDGFVGGERHPDLDRDTGIRDVRRRPMPYPVGADVSESRALQNTNPAAIIGVLRHRQLWIEHRRADIGRVFEAGGIR